MKRIIIICEGETEQEFVREVLYQPFFNRGLSLDHPKIKHTGGGIVKWGFLKKQIERHLQESDSPYVTTFIDYYGINERHLFPAWEEAHEIPDKGQCIDRLQQAMREDLREDLRYRFIPYIQLHEFEALLFIDAQAIGHVVGKAIDRVALERILAEFPDPEMINNQKETSPSHRLIEIIPDYDKVLHGNLIAKKTGLEPIRAKARRFDRWLVGLEELV